MTLAEALDRRPGDAGASHLDMADLAGRAPQGDHGSPQPLDGPGRARPRYGHPFPAIHKELTDALDRCIARLVVHGTKKFLDGVGRPSVDPSTESTTALGSWFATVLVWKPQVALFVNVRTLLPIFVPLAPARSVVDRFPASLDEVLHALDIVRPFIDHELVEMESHVLAKTNSRSVLGSMNDFIFMAEADREREHPSDLVSLSVRLANTPCGPLRAATGFPDLELRAVVDGFIGARSGPATHLRLVE